MIDQIWRMMRTAPRTELQIAFKRARLYMMRKRIGAPVKVKHTRPVITGTLTSNMLLLNLGVYWVNRGKYCMREQCSEEISRKVLIAFLKRFQLTFGPLEEQIYDGN